MKFEVRKALGWIITILLPFVILMTAVRMLITPTFAKVEYQMPGFPEDKLGFSMDERLRWATPSIKYLVNSEEITYLEALKFDDGSMIYNERELSHMEDVKNLVQVATKVWLGCVALILLMILLLDNLKARGEIRKGFYRGGWASVGLVVGLLLLVAINFNELFNWFHYVFFTGDTWLFLESDTLIRLFPLRFWQDAFIFVGGFTIITGVLLLIFLRPTRRH
jgi:integral membrane protein (TIGR01906 family)